MSDETKRKVSRLVTKLRRDEDFGWERVRFRSLLTGGHQNELLSGE